MSLSLNMKAEGKFKALAQDRLEFLRIPTEFEVSSCKVNNNDCPSNFFGRQNSGPIQKVSEKILFVGGFGQNMVLKFDRQ